MANKVFLDTNIIIDFIVKRDIELLSTEKILNGIFNNEIEGYISESVITNCIYLLRKNKIAVLEIIRELCKHLQIVKFDTDILYMPVEKFSDTEDGLLYFLAHRNKLNYFITRNKKDFKHILPSLSVLTPDEFINTIHSTNDIP